MNGCCNEKTPPIGEVFSVRDACSQAIFEIERAETSIRFILSRSVRTLRPSTLRYSERVEPVRQASSDSWGKSGRFEVPMLRRWAVSKYG